MAAASRNATTNFGISAMDFGISTEVPRSGLGPCDLVPQGYILLLVGRPDLGLGNLAEGRHVGLDHRHALGLERLLGGAEIVDRFVDFADLDLRLATEITHQLVLVQRY